MGEPSWGVLGIGVPGSMVLASGDEGEEADTTMSLGLTYDIMIDLLNAKSLVMAGWIIGLYAIPITFTPTRTVSDYEGPGMAPSFTGYTTQSLGLWTAAFLASGQVQKQAPLVVWTPGNALNPGPVYGYYVKTGAGKLVGAQDNPAGPVTVGGTLQPFTVFPIFRESPFI